MNYVRPCCFIPGITKQTQFWISNSEIPSLLDQTWIHVIDNFTKGIFLLDITDQYPIILYLPLDVEKYGNNEAFMNVIADLHWSNIIASKHSTYVDNCITNEMTYTVISSLHVPSVNPRSACLCHGYP